MSVLDSDDGKKLLAMVEVGIDAEVFLGGNLGGYILQRVMEDREAALNRLEVVDPSNAHEVRKAQDDARVPLMFLQYLNDCIQEGKNAERQLYAAEE